ncbi:MAG: hypothetical protein P1S46_10490, partial [bacterium]|nr:hypothetical protein [bacterium]
GKGKRRFSLSVERKVPDWTFCDSIIVGLAKRLQWTFCEVITIKDKAMTGTVPAFTAAHSDPGMVRARRP